MPEKIHNGDFEDGLNGWHIVSGQAFSGQPILADSVNAKDVLINGKPVVPLGGNYWQVPYPLAEEGKHLIRISSTTLEILDSDVFEIVWPFLSFRLGGSATTDVAVELRVPVANAGIPGFPALDPPDADGFVAVRIQNPTGTNILHPIGRQNPGSDILRQFTLNLTGKRLNENGLLKSKAKVRLRINGKGTMVRFAVDKIQLLPRPPGPLHLPLWGWADIHCHPMAQAGFGGLLAGHMHGPVEDLGSCLHEHGVNHSNYATRLAITIIQGGTRNDGSLAVPGWTVGTALPGDTSGFPAAKPGDELGFSGWPRFNDLTHIKTHQDWIRRSYDGGQRLMVALVVHTELLASLARFPPWLSGGQSDRDTVEPQVQMLREFIVHNQDWCGLARTPAEARALIEQNKMAFVLGLETDSINGWIRESDFNNVDDTESNRNAIRDTIYPYFEYLRNLGIVQINLVHLSDNAFGGMALYDSMFLYNTWHRTGVIPATEESYTGRTPDEQICNPISFPSSLLTILEMVAKEAGVDLPQAWINPNYPRGNRNVRPMTIAGKVAMRVAMKLGMVIDMDHMSEKCTVDANNIAMTAVQIGDTYQPYPLIAAHNGARKISPRPPQSNLDDPKWSNTADPKLGYRWSPESWPSEGSKSETQLDYIINTGTDITGRKVGIFGHGTAVGDTKVCPDNPLVDNDCPGTTKSFAQSYQYVSQRLNLPVALGTDLNVLLGGLGPRFGPLSAHGLIGEVEIRKDFEWRDTLRRQRLNYAEAQKKGVYYSTPIRDWRAYRFPDSGLYNTYTNIPGKDPEVKEGIGHLMWQAVALNEVISNDPQIRDKILAFAKAYTQDPQLDLRVVNMVAGMINAAPVPSPTSFVDFRTGQLMADETAYLPAELPDVREFVPILRRIRVQWKEMTSKDNNPPLIRCTAGPVRDFDFNLDGLAHYGMLPDMLQDLRNVKLPLDGFFRSAEGYIRVWERCTEVGGQIKLWGDH